MKNVISSLLLTSIALSLTACTGDIISPRADSPQNAQSEGLEMLKQEVKRYDCDGSLISDQVEVTQTPTKKITIAPTTVNYGTIVSASFVDRQTGAMPGAIFDNETFSIDHGNGYFNMKVTDGINEIHYEFTFSNAEKETGSRFINVTYSETLVPGFVEYRPSASECNKP